MNSQGLIMMAIVFCLSPNILIQSCSQFTQTARLLCCSFTYNHQRNQILTLFNPCLRADNMFRHFSQSLSLPKERYKPNFIVFLYLPITRFHSSLLRLVQIPDCPRHSHESNSILTLLKYVQPWKPAVTPILVHNTRK